MRAGIIQQLMALTAVAALPEETPRGPKEAPPAKSRRPRAAPAAPRDLRVPSESPVAVILRAERLARKQAAWDARHQGTR